MGPRVRMLTVQIELEFKSKLRKCLIGFLFVVPFVIEGFPCYKDVRTKFCPCASFFFIKSNIFNTFSSSEIFPYLFRVDERSQFP